MVQVLFRNKSAHTKNILSFLDAKFFKIFWIFTELWRRHTIVNDVAIVSMIHFLELVVNNMRDDNHFIGIFSTPSFTKSKHHFC